MGRRLHSHPPHTFKCRSLSFKAGLLFLFTFIIPAYANAQNIFSFKDDSQLKMVMAELAAASAKNSKLPEPCQLHIVAIAGGRELFVGDTFDKMNTGLARGIIGDTHLAECQIAMHELNRDSANQLLARLEPQGKNVLVLEATYIPLTESVVAFTKLRDGTGRFIGESGRYDLPVVPTSIITTAAISAPKVNVDPAPAPEPKINAAPAPAPEPAQTPKPAALSKPEPKPAEPPKLVDKFLTEVHFDSGSADITVVGDRKIKQAIEAIKKQNPRQVRILGFTDSKGDAAANKSVATARADSVAQMLRKAGINVPLIVEGKGEEGGPHQIPDGVSEPLNRCVGIIAVGVPEGQ